MSENQDVERHLDWELQDLVSWRVVARVMGGRLD